MMSLIISHTSMVSSEGLQISGALAGQGLVGFLHFSLSSYHLTSCSIQRIIVNIICWEVHNSFVIIELSLMEDEIQIQMGDYTFTQKYCIGEGSYGKVYRGLNRRTNRQVAIKEMDGQLITEDEIRKEITILKQLKHPNIVEYEDAFQNNGYFYIITEYCRGGDLRNLVDSDQEDEQVKQRKILDMFWQVCEGFKYLQQFNIIHRDLKPSNILSDKGLFKIADFGLARRQMVHKSVTSQDMMGVPIYMSPQILSKNFYTYKCDVWSMGVIVFELLFERLPWKYEDVETLFFSIMNHPYPYKDQKIKNPIFVLIFERTLSYLQKQRASWEQLLNLKQNKSPTKSRKNGEEKVSNKREELSSSRFHKKISRDEAQILNHLYGLGQNLDSELISLTNKDFFTSFLQAIKKYLVEGPEWQGMLRDCCFIFLRMLGERLYLQIMECEKMEQSRQLLIFIELLHDYIVNTEHPKTISKENFKSSLRSKDISEYAASVISKINTFLYSFNKDK